MFQSFAEVTAFFNKRQQLGIKPGLERIRLLLKMQENPENDLKAIHIAGTNGKGSTTSLLNTALMACGYRTGVFTSPSMEGLTGHILINDQPLEEAEFVDLFNRLFPAIQILDANHLYPTTFEILTVLAFMHFSGNVDIAIIEAGMGGKEDTTNCFKPILSIITNVEKDHMAFLGNTLHKIASHKAGIIKAGVPVIMGKLNEEARQVVEDEAKSKEAPMYRSTLEFGYTNRKQDELAQHFIWHDRLGNTTPVALQLKGAHQADNAAIALMALQLLREAGYVVEREKALKALEQLQIPGRFERIGTNPEIILDAAHNPAGIDAFLNTVSGVAPHKEKQLIFSGFKDKELELMVGKCIPYFHSITITATEHQRAMHAEQLAQKMQSEKIKAIASWKEAVNEIFTRKSQQEVCYFITGSFYFIFEVRKYLLALNN